jgi:hypothetical protein
VVEWLGITADTCPADDDGTIDDDCDRGFIAIPMPSTVLRYGAAENLDLGAKSGAHGTLGLDLKFQLLRSDLLDIAIDPGFSFLWAVGVVTAPVLFSLNLGDTITFTIAPLPSYMFLTAGDSSNFFDGFFMGASGSLQIRASEDFGIAIGAEYSGWVAGDGDVDPLGFGFFSFGVGLLLGAQPDYGREPEQVAPPPPPVAPAPAPVVVVPATEPAPAPAAAPATIAPATEPAEPAPAPEPGPAPETPPGY